MGFDVILIMFVIAIVIFLIGFLILRKRQPTKNNFKNPILWITTIVLTPLIYIGLIFLWITIATHYPQRDFNQEKWIKDKETRYEYADDLVDNENLIGQTKAQILELLGEPDYETEMTITYCIGFSPRHFIGIDPDWLEIEFINGKASKVRIYNS
jgi:amino acid transporter